MTRFFFHSSQPTDPSRLPHQRLPSATATDDGAQVVSCPDKVLDGSAPVIDRDLSLAVLRGMDLSRRIIIGTRLTGADMRGCTLDGAIMYNTDLSQADMTGASLIGTCLVGANISKACFAETNLTETDFSGATAVGTDFRTALFDRTCLIGARCSTAHFGGSDFSRFDFAGADLMNVRFEGAHWDGTLLVTLPKVVTIGGRRITLVDGRIMRDGASTVDDHSSGVPSHHAMSAHPPSSAIDLSELTRNPRQSTEHFYDHN